MYKHPEIDYQPQHPMLQKFEPAAWNPFSKKEKWWENEENADKLRKWLQYWKKYPCDNSCPRDVIADWKRRKEALKEETGVTLDKPNKKKMKSLKLQLKILDTRIETKKTHEEVVAAKAKRAAKNS